MQQYRQAIAEFILFGVKMAWACLFGGAMLAMLIGSHLWWPADAPIYRYDALLLAAVVIQALMLAFRLETLAELKVILLYHLAGTVMEIFKTAVGSWYYPEPSLFHIGGVPLFTGFMYGTIGSFIVRAIRLFDMRFSNYPPHVAVYGLAAVVYLNFFGHHYFWDLRYVLFAAFLALFWRCRIYFVVDVHWRSMPLPVTTALSALFLWIAENIGTVTRTWIYPHQQNGWQMVGLQKMGAWGLLLILSFAMVTLVVRPQPPER